MQTWNVTRPSIALQGLLLEGPFFDEATRECRIIDIVGETVHTYNVDAGPSEIHTITSEECLG